MGKVVSFLSKAGKILAQVGGAVKIFGPLIKSYVPDSVDKAIDQAGSLSDKLNVIVLSTEAAAVGLGTAGPDKLKQAAPHVAALLVQLDQFKGKKIDRPELIDSAAQKIASGWADLLNAYSPDSVED